MSEGSEGDGWRERIVNSVCDVITIVKQSVWTNKKPRLTGSFGASLRSINAHRL